MDEVLAKQESPAPYRPSTESPERLILHGMLPRRGERYVLADIQAAVAEKLLESETLDYKAESTKLETIVAKAVSALSNSAGGVILLGMDESPTGEPIETAPPGLPAMIGRVPAAEQIDRWIRTKVFPNPPASVDSVPAAVADRVYVTIVVSPRSLGPYRIVNTPDPALNGRYYMRRGRESVEADHYYLRRLFAEAEEGTTRVRSYLAQRGFGNEYDDSFADRDPARRLRPVIIARNPGGFSGMDLSLDYKGGASHRCVAVALPEVLRGEVIDTSRAEVQDALNVSKWDDLKTFGARQIPTLDGRALERAADDPSRLLTYVHVHRTGYVEGARCDSAVMYEDRPLFDAVRSLQALRAVLGVVGRLQKVMETHDKWLVSLMLRRTQATELFPWAPWGFPRGTSNVPGMRIEEIVEASQLDEPWTLLRRFDLRMFNAFGVDKGMAVLEDSDGFNRLEM